MMIRTCKNCRFYAELPDKHRGQCRRHPPQAALLPTPNPLNQRQAPSPQVVPFWPIVESDQWCGELEVPIQ